MTDRRPLLRAIYDAAVAAAHPDVSLLDQARRQFEELLVFAESLRGIALCEEIVTQPLMALLTIT